jgi:hypothetical protein
LKEVPVQLFSLLWADVPLKGDCRPYVLLVGRNLSGVRSKYSVISALAKHILPESCASMTSSNLDSGFLTVASKDRGQSCEE